MRILVTGASGFLGNTLCPRLRQQGHDIVATDSTSCNLLNPDNLNQFNTDNFEQIYHLAAWTQAGDFCLYHSGEQWIINQAINTNVLAWWQKRQPQAKLISIGTSCAYDPSLRLVEENYLQGTPIESLFTYAMTKRMLYVGQLALQKQFGLKSLHIVPSTLYGPNYKPKGEQMHFSLDMIKKIVAGKEFGEPIVLWGDGHQKRELIHVEDFVRITIELAKKLDNDIVNIGSGEEFSIRHFAKLICDKVEFDFDLIQFDQTRYVGARSKSLVIDKLKRILPDLALKTLEKGLGETIDNFCKENKRIKLKQ
jgi:GDP-L-fucose synthase